VASVFFIYLAYLRTLAKTKGCDNTSLILAVHVPARKERFREPGSSAHFSQWHVFALPTPGVPRHGLGATDSIDNFSSTKPNCILRSKKKTQTKHTHIYTHT